VWWFADVWGSRYYGDDVTVDDPWASNICIRPDGFSGRYEELPRPDVIVLSKPGICDKNGTLREFIRKGGYHPHAQHKHLSSLESEETSAWGRSQ
jgi:hypothetical protein